MLATAKCTILSWDVSEKRGPRVEIVAKDDLTEVVFTVSYMMFGDAETISYEQLGALLGASSKHEILEKIDNLVGLACRYCFKKNGEYENFTLYPIGVYRHQERIKVIKAVKRMTTDFFEVTPLESDVNKAFKRCLDKAPWLLMMRNNQGSRGPVRYGLGKGSADYVGLRTTDGRFVAIELKRPGEKPTPEQRDWLIKMKLGGAICTCIDTVDTDCIMAILNWLRTEDV